MSEFHGLANLHLAKETGQRNEPKLPLSSVATAAGNSVGTGAPSHCPTVLKGTRHKTWEHKLCASCSAGKQRCLWGWQTWRPQTGSYGPLMDVSSSAQLKIILAF